MNLERLSHLREDADLKQLEIANTLNIARVNISKWETNKEIIPLDKLNEYANYFNTSIDYILNLSNKKYFSFNSKKLNKKIIGSRLKKIIKKSDNSKGISIIFKYYSIHNKFI